MASASDLRPHRKVPVLMEERLHNLRRGAEAPILDETAATIDFSAVIRSVDKAFSDPTRGNAQLDAATNAAARTAAELLEYPSQETPRFPIIDPVPTSTDELFLTARRAYQDGDLALLQACADTIGSYALEGYTTLWALEIQLKTDSSDPIVHAAFDRFRQAHAGEYLGELATVRYLKLASDVLNRETYERLFQSLSWNQDNTTLQNGLAFLRLQDAIANNSVNPTILEETRRLLRDQMVVDDNFRALSDLLARADRAWSWDRVLIALQKRQWTEAKRNLGGVPRPLLPASLSTLEGILDHPQTWYAQVEKNFSSVPARLGVFATLRLISYNRQKAAKLLDGIEGKLRANWSALLWTRLGYSAAVDRRPDAARWFARAGKTLIDPNMMVDLGNVLAWQARNAIYEGNLYTLRNILDRMPPDVRQREEWIYWGGRAHDVRGNHTAARKLYESIADHWSFYGKLACDALQRPYPKMTFPGSSNNESVRAWADHPGIRRAEAFYRMHLYADGHREWNWSMRGLDDKGRLALAEYARRAGWVHRMINTAERVDVLHTDFSYRYPTPLLSIIQRASDGQNLPTEWTYGLIRQESRFIVQASSAVGARGLMQIMPKTASWIAGQLGLGRYEAEQISDVEMNLILGTAYLRMLYESLDESYPLATAAYNAGPSRARLWRKTLKRPLEAAAFIESIPFYETREYVKNVMANMHTYSLVLHGKAPNFTKQLGSIRPSPATRTHLP